MKEKSGSGEWSHRARGKENKESCWLGVCAPLGGAVGIAIKAAEHFPERFVWSEGLMENGRMLKTPIYGHVFNFR